MTEFRFIFVLFIFFNILGCANRYGPVDNVEFNQKVNLKDLDATYVNVMESEEGYISLFSKYLWPYAHNLPYKETLILSSKHNEIDFINISLAGNGLLFEAVLNACIVLSKRIEIDDRFDNGQFRISSRYRFWSEVHIGPDYNKNTIGIDKKSDGKLRRLDRAGGLAFWIIPFVIFDTRDYRIKKMPEKLSFPQCKTHNKLNEGFTLQTTKQ